MSEMRVWTAQASGDIRSFYRVSRKIESWIGLAPPLQEILDPTTQVIHNLRVIPSIEPLVVS